MGNIENPNILNFTNDILEKKIVINYSDDTDKYGKELYLTPFLKTGNTKVARDMCKVINLAKIDSYSAYLTVNEEYNSNMFFWFFPAMKNPESEPVILWLQGGPGSSSLIGLFNGCGPFSVNSEGILRIKETTWVQNHSVLFIDNPVGSGLSFTEHDDGYVSNQEEVCKDLYKGLLQFFEIFPEFQHQDFFIAGQSYAGKYVPHLGLKIHQENINAKSFAKINLKGLIIGSSFTDPLIQLDWGDFLYNMGLIGVNEKEYFDSETKKMKHFIRTEEWFHAFEIMQNLMFAFPPPMTSYYEKTTGLSNTFNLLESKISETFYYYRNFLEKPIVRKSIHVGKKQFEFGKTKENVFMSLAEDIPKSARPEMENLLNLGYRMLLYSSQFDVVVPHTAVNNLLNSLNWIGSNKFFKSERQIWKVHNECAGYVRECENMTHVFIRNAGHMATFDQPEWCFDMITKFTRNFKFNSNITLDK